MGLGCFLWLRRTLRNYPYSRRWPGNQISLRLPRRAKVPLKVTFEKLKAGEPEPDAIMTGALNDWDRSLPIRSDTAFDAQAGGPPNRFEDGHPREVPRLGGYLRV